MAIDWWNNSGTNKNYAFRRNLQLTPDTGTTIKTGYPVYAELSYSSLIAANKIRSDYQDIEVLHYNDGVWTIIPKLITLSGDTLSVNFNVVSDITTTNTQYYIYMCNPNLLNRPTVATYTEALYVIDTSTDGGIGLSYTRPTEDWLEGTSLVDNAKVTFSFNGVNAKVVMEKGPNRGIVELILDNKTPQLIDLYNQTVSQTTIYTTSGLTVDQHYIRMRATGDKAPASSGSSIKLSKVLYSKFTKATLLSEEIVSYNRSITVMVGP